MFGKRIVKVQDNNTEELKKTIGEGKGKSLILIYYGEEIYINNLEIPTTRKKYTESIIMNELINNFKDISKLCYSFEVLEVIRGRSRVAAYCINTDKNDLFDDDAPHIKITAVYLIQFCYINYVNKVFKVKDYILVFNSFGHTYIVGCRRGALLCSSTIEDFHSMKQTVCGKINDIAHSNIFSHSTKAIPLLFLNYDTMEMAELHSDNYYIKSLGHINEEKIINKFIGVF